MLDRILVTLDGSSVAECALPHAMSAALAFKGGLRLVRVLSPTGEGRIPDPVDCRFRRAEAAAYLTRIAGRVRETGIPCETVVTEGDPAEAISEAAGQWPADLVVMSTHGSGARRRSPSGSIAAHVAAALDRSILMVPASEAGIALFAAIRYHRILVPLDCSPRSNAVVQMATALGHPCEAELVLAHVVPVPDLPQPDLLLDSTDLEIRDRIVASSRRIAEQALDDLARVPRAHSVRTRVRLEPSTRVAHALFRLVREETPDLVIMSARGHGHADDGPADWPCGSVSARILAYGTVPRLILKEDGSRRRPPTGELARDQVPGRRPFHG
jgi:nucleotide-binding universal stress UspA family protein